MRNPLRLLGLARIVAGCWFIRTGTTTLLQYRDLLPQAQRLFGGDTGSTDAPIRSFLTLVLAGLLPVIGLVLVVQGALWLRRSRRSDDTPAVLERDEVIAVLMRRELPAFCESPTPAHWSLRRWLADQLGDLTWWRRDLMSRGVRAFARASGFAVVIAVVCIAVPLLAQRELLGPFPTSFVVWLLAITALWAALSLMLIPEHGPRVEPVTVLLQADPIPALASGTDQIIETTPLLLDAEPATIGLTLGVVGVAVQCLMLSWWNLSTIGYELIATSIIRHAGSILGGLFFFILGQRMVTMAAELLSYVRHASTLILVHLDGGNVVATAAEIRTESLGIAGVRQATSAAAGAHVREAAPEIVAERWSIKPARS